MGVTEQRHQREQNLMVTFSSLFSSSVYQQFDQTQNIHLLTDGKHFTKQTPTGHSIPLVKYAKHFTPNFPCLLSVQSH